MRKAIESRWLFTTKRPGHEIRLFHGGGQCVICEE